MTRLRLNRSVERTASGGVRAVRGWIWLAGWLAVMAILVQTVVPDFAMAARNAARQQAKAAVALQVQHPHHAHHQDHKGMAQPDKSAPADRHPHEELCAFCLALNTHGTPTHPGADLAVPVSYAATVVLAQPGIRPPQLFFVGSGARAPPAAEQV